MNKIISKALGFTKDHSPELLISLGVVGMSTSTILAVKSTPKAIQLIEEKKEDLGVTCLTKKEVIEAAWKAYIPTVGLGIVSIACITLGTTKSLKRNTALATVYALSESTLKDYQRKTVELAGKEKAEEINREVAKGRVKETVVINQNDCNDYVASTGEGDYLIFDTLSGRYFRSSMNAIDRSVNYINRQLRTEHTMTVNDFYNEINIPTVGIGHYLGWKLEQEDLEIRYDSDIDKNGIPYLILSYTSRPLPM